MSIQIKTIAVTGEKQTEIMNLTTPDLRNGEALIKVHAVALCTLEQRIFRGEVKMPLPCTGGNAVSWRPHFLVHAIAQSNYLA